MKPLSTKVTKKEISVDNQIKRIRDKFKLNKRINFLDMFEKQARIFPYMILLMSSITLLDAVRCYVHIVFSSVGKHPQIK